MPNFDEPPNPEKPNKPKRTPRREQVGANVGRRIKMASRGGGSIRATFQWIYLLLPFSIMNITLLIILIPTPNYISS